MNFQNVEIDFDQIISSDNYSPSLIEDDTNDINESDHEDHIHQHYIQMFMHDYMNDQRAKKDKEFRQKTRKMFSILSQVMDRVHSDPLIDASNAINIELVPDTNRGRDSDLRTLQNANKLLQSLLEKSRELKRERANLRKDLKVHKKYRQKAKKRLRCVTNSQASTFHKKTSVNSQYLVCSNKI